MRRLSKLLLGLVTLGGLCLVAFIFFPVQRTPPSEVFPSDWTPDPREGEYAMRASDCIACHTAEGGEDFAGGRPIKSALGTVYSANITPEPDTGIGRWTLDDFRAALIDGISADGSHLYPAMPYENYRILTERDIRAIYHYLMAEVAPISRKVNEPDLIFPFNQRWGIRVLNWLTLQHEPGFQPLMMTDLLNRGQYLVEGPGHCAACHSPRTFYFGQDGIQSDEESFLSGGYIDGWEAPPLRGPSSVVGNWSVEELTAFLATGRNRYSTANGEMSLVVEHSLQHLRQTDLQSIARFLKVLDGAADRKPISLISKMESAEPPEPATADGEATAHILSEASPQMPLGARLFLDNCSHCHFVTGRGSPQIFPALQGNSLVLSDEIEPLITIILRGAEVPGTKLRPMPLVMQGYAKRLDDAEVAALASFIRGAWGNNSTGVSTEAVAKIRERLRVEHPASR